MIFLSFKSMIFMIVASVYSATINARCELLVVQKGPNGLSSLTNQAAEKHGQEISETLHKYQWPMCAVSNLTEQEKKALLTAHKPFAEEQFVQKKLQEKVGKENIDIGVVFVPTTLYDLFCLHQFYKNDDSMLRKTVFGMMKKDKEEYLDLEPILNEDTDIKTIKQNVVDAYQEVNAQFINSNRNALLETNQAFASFLFDSCPKLADCRDGLTASKIIQENSQQLAQELVSKLVSLNDSIRVFSLYDNRYIKRDIEDLVSEEKKDLIAKIIEHEYQARDQNKALLVRGTSCEPFKIGFDDNNKVEKMLVGSTLRDQLYKDVYDEKGNYKDSYKISLRQAYEQNYIKPYSISFGSSLFAGIVRDRSACANHYLSGKRTRYETSTSAGKIAGYALFVDKKEYDANRNNQLLFIPPLASIAALFGCGEYFHPRSIAAIIVKKKEKERIKGLWSDRIKDLAGLILIERDPLEHAALFSAFLAQNGKIIQRGSHLTEEEKKFPEEVLANQAEAAQLYQEMSKEAPPQL